MAITGSCHGCGAVATLFDVESAGAKLCQTCVSLQVQFAGEVVEDRRRVWANRNGEFGDGTEPRHDQVHVVGIGSCPACRARWGWV